MEPFNSVEDVAADRSFGRWVLHDDPSAEKFWLDYLARHPEKRPLVEEARRFLQELPRTRYRLSEQQLELNWQRIAAALPRPRGTPPPQRTVRRLRWYYPAASFAVLALVATFWFYGAEDAPSYQTAYGEVKQWVLPDGSQVTLNANSSLRYQQHGSQREVWLQGEGFFEVVHTSDDQTFVVHTRGPEVAVLGTAFYVNNREEQVRVVLNSGWVSVRHEQQEVRMVPGELVAYHEATHRLSKQLTDPDLHSAWKDNQLIFDRTPLSEIAQLLKDRYGFEVIFEDASVGKEAFTGTFPADRIAVLLKTLQKSTPMTIKGRQIVFGPSLER